MQRMELLSSLELTQGRSCFWEHATSFVPPVLLLRIKGRNPEITTNWTGSSAAMETDILVKGFRQSENSYGLRYMRVIRDGDSSVMATICTAVPYGMFTEKLECAKGNHACKCYRNHLKEPAKDHPEFCGKASVSLYYVRARYCSHLC